MFELPQHPFPDQFEILDLEKVSVRLGEMTVALDHSFEWPVQQLHEVQNCSAQAWIIPEEYGGLNFSSDQMTWGYMKLAMGCLTTTFILTQQNGACQRVIQSENSDLKSRILPLYAKGERTASVGISHLTTSRQYLDKPIVSAEKTEGGYIYQGLVPWVTGACCVDDILIGATLPDGLQMLAIVPRESDGVVPEKPVSMLALNSSMTGPVKLENVFVPEENVVAGPIENVMKVTSGGPGSLTTSALALGVAGNCISRMEKEASKREDLMPVFENFREEFFSIFQRMFSLYESDAKSCSDVNAESVRKESNSIVLRASQAYLGASKGAGYISGHPAEKSVREAMFFLVWSCPQPVLNAALRDFACLIEG